MQEKLLKTLTVRCFELMNFEGKKNNNNPAFKKENFKIEVQ